MNTKKVMIFFTALLLLSLFHCKKDPVPTKSAPAPAAPTTETTPVVTTPPETETTPVVATPFSVTKLTPQNNLHMLGINAYQPSFYMESAQSDTTVIITFLESATGATTSANYSIVDSLGNPLAVTSVAFLFGNTYTLTTATQTAGEIYKVSVTRITSATGETFNADSTATNLFIGYSFSATGFWDSATGLLTVFFSMPIACGDMVTTNFTLSGATPTTIDTSSCSTLGVLLKLGFVAYPTEGFQDLVVNNITSYDTGSGSLPLFTNTSKVMVQPEIKYDQVKITTTANNTVVLTFIEAPVAFNASQISILGLNISSGVVSGNTMILTTDPMVAGTLYDLTFTNFPNAGATKTIASQKISFLGYKSFELVDLGFSEKTSKKSNEFYVNFNWPVDSTNGVNTSNYTVASSLTLTGATIQSTTGNTSCPINTCVIITTTGMVAGEGYTVIVSGVTSDVASGSVALYSGYSGFILLELSETFNSDPSFYLSNQVFPTTKPVNFVGLTELASGLDTATTLYIKTPVLPAGTYSFIMNGLYNLATTDFINNQTLSFTIP